MKKSLSVISFLFIILGLSGQDSKGNNKWISDTIDAIHYDIHILNIDFTGHSLDAFCILDLQSKINGLDEVRLELMDLTVDSVKVNGTNISNYTHTGDILNIPLPFILNNGQNVSIRIRYHGIPFHEDWGGFHWNGEYAFNLGVGFVSIPHNLGKTWFPCIDDFHDRATYDIFTTLPEGKMAVCGGLLVETINNGNNTFTWHWQITHTIPTYLASVAVGNYAGVTDTYNGINGAIPIGIYVRPQDTAKVDGSFENLKEIMAIYENCFGSYPFERIGYVGTSIGAMEHACNIAYPNFCIDNTNTYEDLYAHELSHMWFGDGVTCESAEDMWINEGWATFCAFLYKEYLYGKEQYNDDLREKLATILQFCHTPQGDGSYFPLNQIPQEITYGMTAYDRGSTIAHTIRGYLGDEVFFSSMQDFMDGYVYDFASSYDMRDAISTSSGINMNDFFDNWVFTAGTPHFSIDSFNIIQDGKNESVEVFVRQRRKGVDFTGNSNILEVTFMDAGWNMHSAEVHFSGSTGSAVFDIPFTPEIVMCDFNERLCDAVTHYTRVINSTGSKEFKKTFFYADVQQVSDSAFMHVEHNWVAPDPFKDPIPGVTLSDYRYWKVDGIWPEDFVSKGRFFYNKNGYLDNNLLVNENDSIVLMYRTDPSDDWKMIPFTQTGTWQIGWLIADTLLKGEYTIAVSDATHVGASHPRSGSNNLKIFPNPVDHYCDISFKPGGEKDYVAVTDASGKKVDEIRLQKGQEKCRWNNSGFPAGVYNFTLFSGNNIPIDSLKVIISEH